MPRQPWSHDEAETVLALIELHGSKAFAKYAKTSGRGEEAIRMHIQKAHRAAWDKAMVKWRISGMDADAVPHDGTAALEWLERLRPIAMPAPPKRAVTLAATTGLTLVAGDFHFPEQDDGAVGVFLEACRLLKPERVILNGDLPDLLAVSKYPKDVRAGHLWSLGDEAKAMHGFLHELERVLPRDSVIVETEANHSGNGTASRWWRYLSDAAGALVSLPNAEDKLSYQAWWYPEWSRIQLVEDVLLADDLLILHGDVVRKHAAYSARATMEKWFSSVMHNHTHRQGSGAQRVPSRSGRGEAQLRFYETGCMCTLKPSYASAVNWTQGFAIVQEGGEAGSYGVELVTIDRGAAVVNTLGQLVRAA